MLNGGMFRCMIYTLLQVSSGGLVSALKGVQNYKTLWIGWPGKLYWQANVLHCFFIHYVKWFTSLAPALAECAYILPCNYE